MVRPVPFAVAGVGEPDDVLVGGTDLLVEFPGGSFKFDTGVGAEFGVVLDGFP